MGICELLFEPTAGVWIMKLWAGGLREEVSESQVQPNTAPHNSIKTAAAKGGSIAVRGNEFGSNWHRLFSLDT